MATQLIHLPEVERLSPACIRILGGNPGKFTLQGTNTYLVGTGPQRLLIDTGEGKPSWIAALKRVLEQEKASISAAIITHWHHDHTGGIPQLAAACGPGTTPILVHKHQPDAGQLEIRDGQRFLVEGASLTAVHTPGHTTDHVVLLFEEEDAMFTGDNVLGHGTAVFEDLAAYTASLEKMGRLFGGRAYPGHGPVVQDGPAKVAEYIRHRQQREEQVVQRLRSRIDDPGASATVQGDGAGNAWTVMQLVRSIYSDVPESLHPAAAGGVVQILRKLEKEGKVTVSDDGERWRLVPSSRSAL
jgi:glyoxylase-like metal-dependent hydrolase (beta-lactamase superfamily II)